MTEEALSNGLYMRPLGKKETVLVMASALLEHHATEGRYDLVHALADVTLKHNPREVNAIISKGHAYFQMAKRRFGDKLRKPQELSESELVVWREFGKANKHWYDKAEALGFRMPSKEDDARYLATVRRAQAAQR